MPETASFGPQGAYTESYLESAIDAYMDWLGKLAVVMPVSACPVCGEKFQAYSWPCECPECGMDIGVSEEQWREVFSKVCATINS